MIFNWTKNKQKRKAESGNMILALFGAVAIVGTLAAGTSIIVNGPVKIMSNVNQRTQTESQLMVASKMIMLDVQNLASSGDCDSDRITEPREWRDATGSGPDGVAGSDGGGFIPLEIGTSKRDAWSTQYGYCVWDHGALIDDVTCGGGAQRRLQGFNSIDHPVVAIISAGPNGTFETACLDFASADLDNDAGTMAPDGDLEDTGDLSLITPTGDDIVAIYSYAEAAQDNPGIWQLGVNAAGEGVAILDSSIANVQFNAPSVSGQSTAFGGNLELMGTGADQEGLNIPDQVAMPSCDMTMENEIRRNTSVTPPTLEICQDPGSGYAWQTLGTGGASSSASSDIANAIADPVFDSALGNCIKNTGGPAEYITTVNGTDFNNVYTYGDYVFAATGGSNDRIYVYTFDGSNFTYVADYGIPTNGLFRSGDILSAGQNSGSGGNRFYKINDDGSFTLIPDNPDTGNAYGRWAKDDYFYVGTSGAVHAYYHDKNANVFNRVATTTAVDGAIGFWGHGKYVFAYDGALSALEFDGTTFTELDELSMYNFNRDIYGDMNYIYIADQAGTHSIAFDGQTLTRQDYKASSGGAAYRVWADGTHVFSGTNSGNLNVYKVGPNGELITKEQINPPGTGGTSGAVTDGKFLYVTDNQGLHAYSGYTCTEAVVPNADQDYVAQITVEQDASSGATLETTGYAIAAQNTFTPAAIGFVVGPNTRASSLVNASIQSSSFSGLGFYTGFELFGNPAPSVSLSIAGDLHIKAPTVTEVTSIRIGGKELPWNDTDFKKGLMTISNNGADTGGYFGFWGDSDASNAILFTNELNIRQSNATGSAIKTYLKFESDQATSFFGDLIIKGENEIIDIRHASGSATANEDSTIHFKRSRGNRNGYEDEVEDKDVIGAINFRGADTNTLSSRGPTIRTTVEGAVAPGNVPVDVTFSVPQADFDPTRGNCMNNSGREFLEIAYIDVVNDYAVHSDKEYIYVAMGADGFGIYEFNGREFNQVVYYTGVDKALGFWTDANYLYLADETDGVRAFTFDGTSVTLLDTINTNNAQDIWSDGTYLYVADINSVKALTFDGTSFTLEAEFLMTGDPRRVWGDGTYIYAAAGTAGGLRALTFDGSTFTEVGSIVTGFNVRDVFTDGQYVYATHFAGGPPVNVFSFDGSTFTLLDDDSTVNFAQEVWGDGQYIYVAAGHGMSVYSFDGTSLTLEHVRESNYSTRSRNGVYGDGAYIYSVGVDRLFADAGFECSSEIRLKESGDVGINKRDPEAKLHTGGRVVATEGIRVSDDATCAAAIDEGTIRYNTTSNELEVCVDNAGFGWESLNLNAPAPETLYDCSPLPFDFHDRKDLPIDSYERTNSFIVGGLPAGRSCYITASSESTDLIIYLNGVAQGSTIVEVANGDRIQIEIQTGIGDSCLGTTVSLGDKTDTFNFGTNIGCYPNNFYAEEGNCINNNTGTLTLEDTYDTPSSARGLWGDEKYLYVADNANGVMAFTFDGTSFTLVDTHSTTAARALWSDGTYLYVGDNSAGIRALTFNGVDFTEHGSLNTAGNANSVWGDGQYIYVGDSTVLRAYTFNGSTFTEEGTYTLANNINDLWADGQYIHVAAGGSGVRSYSFDGTTFTEHDSYTTTGNALGIWGDSDYVYVAYGSSGLIVLDFDGTSLTVVDSIDPGGQNWSVWSDGTHIYMASEGTTGLLNAFTLSGGTLSLDDNYSAILDRAFGLWGDGTYIYVAEDNAGIQAFSGFECNATD